MLPLRHPFKWKYLSLDSRLNLVKEQGPNLAQTPLQGCDEKDSRGKQAGGSQFHAEEIPARVEMLMQAWQRLGLTALEGALRSITSVLMK